MPSVTVLDDAVRAVGLPCVVKPVDLAASRGVIRADTMAEVMAAVHRTGALLRAICVPGTTPPLLIEQYIDGAEVALEGVLDGGALEVIALFDKPDPLRGPFFEETLYVTPSRLEPAVQRAVVDEVRAAIAALGLLHGPIHAEVRIDRWRAVRHRGRREVHRGSLLAGVPADREPRARDRAFARGGHPPPGVPAAARLGTPARPGLRCRDAADPRRRSPAPSVGD